MRHPRAQPIRTDRTILRIATSSLDQKIVDAHKALYAQRLFHKDHGEQDGGTFSLVPIWR